MTRRTTTIEVMAENDWMRRLREAGIDFTETARARAEDLLEELARRGGSPEDPEKTRPFRRPENTADGLVEPSRPEPPRPEPSRPEGLLGDPFRAGGAVLGVLRREIRSELVELGLVGEDDLRDLRARVNALDARVSGLEAELAATRAATKVKEGDDKAAAKKPGTKKAAAKKASGAPAKKAAAKKAAAKRAAGPNGQG